LLIAVSAGCAPIVPFEIKYILFQMVKNILNKSKPEYIGVKLTANTKKGKQMRPFQAPGRFAGLNRGDRSMAWMESEKREALIERGWEEKPP